VSGIDVDAFLGKTVSIFLDLTILTLFMFVCSFLDQTIGSNVIQKEQMGKTLAWS
jgi:hypothetical protein